MGRATLLVVLGFIVIFGMVRNNINKTSESSSENASIYTETILARNVANSALSYVLSLYSSSGVDSGTYSGSNFLGGSYTATFTRFDADTSDLIDTLRLTATATYEGVTHTSRVDFISISSLIPEIKGASKIESDSTTFKLSGGIKIVGTDTNMDGTPGPGAPKAGFTFTNPDDSIRLAAAITDSSQIQGSPISEVVSDTIGLTLGEAVAQYAAIADITLPGGKYKDVFWGTQANPVIVYSSDNLEYKGSSIGYGILAVNGKFKMKDSPTWYGIILAASPDSLSIDKVEVGKKAKIYGAMMTSAPKVKIKGKAEIYYSTEAINMVSDMLTSGGVNKKTITKKVWYE